MTTVAYTFSEAELEPGTLGVTMKMPSSGGDTVTCSMVLIVETVLRAKVMTSGRSSLTACSRPRATGYPSSLSCRTMTSRPSKRDAET